MDPPKALRSVPTTMVFIYTKALTTKFNKLLSEQHAEPSNQQPNLGEELKCTTAWTQKIWLRVNCWQEVHYFNLIINC